MELFSRTKENRTGLTLILLTSVITAIAVTAIWTFPDKQAIEQKRYATGMADLLSYASRKYLIQNDAINLTLIGKALTDSQEIDRVVFYSDRNKILGIIGSSEEGPHYTQPVIKDGLLAGYVTVSLNATAFEAHSGIREALLSGIIIFSTTLIGFFVLIILKRSNGSIPIVSVRNEQEHTYYSLFVNVHRGLASNKNTTENAIEDAIAMSNEVCALYPGSPIRVSDQGVLLLLDAENLSTFESIKASWLLQKLLEELETPGVFRFFLTQNSGEEKPSEMTKESIKTFKSLASSPSLRIASLTKPDSISLSEQIFLGLSDLQKTNCSPFEHPVLPDIVGEEKSYTLKKSRAEEDTIRQQVDMILGFKQA